jgi:Mannosyltransferase (PIG-V)
MGVQAIARGRLDPARAEALRAAFLTALWTRVLVLVVAVAAVAIFGVHAGNELSFDRPGLTHPFSGFADTLLSPLARWDSAWYLDIAHSGYGGPSSAFFPLYPVLVRGFAVVSAPGALLVSSYVVSLAALVGALYLLHRLVALELRSTEVARDTVLMLALFPGALWLGAPYSESLFLLLSVGAFYAARTDRWAWAGGCAALASATRSAGIVLLVPLVLLWWGSAERRWRDLAWIALAPLGLIVYSVYLAASIGDGFAYLHLQEVWFRSFAGPLGAVPDGAVAAWDGLRQILSGQRAHVYFTEAGGDPMAAAWHNVELFAFMLLGLVAVVGVVRRLPRAYGAYVVAALVLPLSFPVGPQPLMSLPRFLVVLFPLFMWLALVCRTPRRRRIAFVLLSAGLVAFTARYATWHWVA